MIDVAILGATGTVGQKFIHLLQNHPQFRVSELVASERSAGKKYTDVCKWKQKTSIPQEVAHKTVLSLYADLQSRILFSGLDSSVAYEAEQHYANKGHIVISNSKNHRMEASVPLVIPEINHEHLHALVQQPSYSAKSGGIITNPNCASMAMTLALAPLHRDFTIVKVLVHTMQAISGAGYPGVPSMDILGNVIPYIAGEEEKIELETCKILGSYTPKEGFRSAEIAISAHCNRVPVFDGHTENITIEFKHKPLHHELVQSLKQFRGYPQRHNLYSAPSQPVYVTEIEDRPQPLMDVNTEKGMSSVVGRIRPCNIFDYKFTILGHNTIRGAAGAAILNAECLVDLAIIDI